MVRCYKRKTQKGQHDGTLMLKAVRAVRNGLSIRAVAKDLSLNRTTVGRYVKKTSIKELKTLTGADLKSKMNHRQIFTPKEEILLRTYLLSIYNLFNGLTYKQLRILTYSFARKWNKPLPRNWHKDRMGGIDFVRSFVRKHHDFIPLKPSESTTINRAHCFKKRAVDDPAVGIKSDPLKYHFKKAVADWNASNPGCVFTNLEMAACFAESYHNICTKQDKIDYAYT